MIIELNQFLLFITGTILLNLTPGCDVMFVISQSLVHPRNGVFASLGISTGILVYVLLTVAGLTVILQHSIVIFNLLKIVGAVYLLYLAWQAFIATPHWKLTNKNNQVGGFESYCKGTMTNLLNPKVGLFFLTFLPQFVDESKGSISLQLLTLGLCFMISGTLINLLYVVFFSFFKDRLLQNAHFNQWCNKLTGIVFCIMAVKLMISEQK